MKKLLCCALGALATITLVGCNTTPINPDRPVTSIVTCEGESIEATEITIISPFLQISANPGRTHIRLERDCEVISVKPYMQPKA